MNLMLNTGAYCGRSWEAPEEKRSGPKVGDTTVVERWNGSRWIEVKLVWNGERFVQPEVTR